MRCDRRNVAIVIVAWLLRQRHTRQYKYMTMFIIHDVLAALLKWYEQDCYMREFLRSLKRRRR